MVVISAVSAPLCAWAAAPEQGITSHGIVYARRGFVKAGGSPTGFLAQANNGTINIGMDE